MPDRPVQPVTIRIDDARSVSGLLMRPEAARACFVFAHGAGAGMAHKFMTVVADSLAARDIASLRFQFPYLERGSRRPDPPPLCHATVRAAVAAATELCHGLPLVAGGRSFGGRMSSQAQAREPLPGVRGLAFLGFPLHPAGRPSDERAQHLFQVHVPLLFIQGSRDELAELDRLEALVERLGAIATLEVLRDADHAFHVPARSGRDDRTVLAGAVATLAGWILATLRT